jgi:uncharacterized protein (TIGR02266 family)
LADERALKLARSAREQLGEALQTLQMEELPLSLFDVTAQVAKAMGLLLRFEQEAEPKLAEQGLLAVRTTLGVLQTCSPRVPAVDKAAQAVAAALGLVHSVHELAALPAAVPPTVGRVNAVAAPGAQSNDRSKTKLGHHTPQANPDHTDTVREPLSSRSSDAMRAKQASQPGVSSQSIPVSVVQAPLQPVQAVAAPVSALMPKAAGLRKETLSGAGPDLVPNPEPAPTAEEQHRSVARDKKTEPEPRRAPGNVEPTRAKQPAASNETTAPERKGTMPAIRAEGRNGDRVNVALGAHSASNFFAGLAGMNVFANGGLFIATYDVVQVGQQLNLTVMLPGGNEFSAEVVVVWQRDPARHTASGSPPGYGVKFTRITEAGRKLIDRYVAHREPFFYDEL